jgi:hypothetical protein
MNAHFSEDLSEMEEEIDIDNSEALAKDIVREQFKN